MKQRIPADVERLMWLVAENNDPQAIADFESRFPDLRYELAQRRRMVADIKHAKGGVVPTNEIPIPAFRPRAVRPSSSPRQVLVATALGLAALAVASYSITRLVTAPVTRPEPPPVVKTEVPSTPTGGGVIYKTPPTTQTTTGSTETNQLPQQTPETTGPRTEQPKTVKMSNTSLVAALKMIGAESGYNVDVAPGFEDQTVTLDYESATASQILKDLGLRYGFTAFDQGDGTIIIVPAVDDGHTPDSDLNGSQRKLGG